jgi:hypothetical protein
MNVSMLIRSFVWLGKKFGVGAYADAREEKTGDGAEVRKDLVRKSPTREVQNIAIDNLLFISNHCEELSVLVRSVAVAGRMDVWLRYLEGSCSSHGWRFPWYNLAALFRLYFQENMGLGRCD